MAGGMLLWGCGTLRLHVPTGTSIHTEAKCSAPGYLRHYVDDKIIFDLAAEAGLPPEIYECVPPSKIRLRPKPEVEP
jgi:uridine phosphorylase|tara:strand:- start:245 stop:475 length:231 start_codon:yes stop_codon:yes gene_type:complete